MPDFLSIVNMAGPNPCTMALMATSCSETSEKTRDHSCKYVEDASLPISERLLGSRFCLLRLARTLAGRRVMLSCSARTAGRGKSVQPTAQFLLPVGASCRCDVDR